MTYEEMEQAIEAHGKILEAMVEQLDGFNKRAIQTANILSQITEHISALRKTQQPLGPIGPRESFGGYCVEDDLRDRLKRSVEAGLALCAALEWYGNPENYTGTGMVYVPGERGAMARRNLNTYRAIMLGVSSNAERG